MSSISSSSFSTALSFLARVVRWPCESGADSDSFARMRSISVLSASTLASFFRIFSILSRCFSVKSPRCSRQSSVASASSAASGSASAAAPQPAEAPSAAAAAAAAAFARASACNARVASSSDIFSSARSFRRSSRESPSSGMSSCAPATINVREDWPNRIWSPTNTGAWTRDLSLRRLTNVPWVLPASYRNISSPPSENWSTAWRRDEDGCSRTTSLSGVRPRARRLRPRQSTTSTMAPSLSTSREKSEEGRPPHSGSTYPPPAGAGGGAEGGSAVADGGGARVSAPWRATRSSRSENRGGGGGIADFASRASGLRTTASKRGGGGGIPIASLVDARETYWRGKEIAPSPRRANATPNRSRGIEQRRKRTRTLRIHVPCQPGTSRFKGPRVHARRHTGRRARARRGGLPDVVRHPPRGVDSDHAAPRHVRCRDALATSIVPERTSRLVVLTVPDRCRVSPSASSRRTPRPGAAWSAP